MKQGDKVIALSDSPNEQSQFRRKGSVYLVNKTTHCMYCMRHLINIGQRTNFQAVKCRCGTMLHTSGFMWTPTDEFVLLADKDKALQRAVEVEDYEFAAKLRDL
jgi:hypothetical protein